MEKATDKFYARNWVKAINVIEELNKYFKSNHLDVCYSILKNRSIQSEGAFGILKEDYGFDRLS